MIRHREPFQSETGFGRSEILNARRIPGTSVPEAARLFIHRKLRPVKEKASGQMRSSQKSSLLARGTKAVLPKQWFAGGTNHTFVLSQEIASCEIKSLRPDVQLAEKKPARARNKSCAAKAVIRGGEAYFCSVRCEMDAHFCAQWQQMKK